MTPLLDAARRATADLLPALVSHVWSSTLFLLAMLAVLFALRHRLTAGARFSLALVGLAKFALPDSLVGAALRSLTEPFDSRGPFEVPLQMVAGALQLDLAPAPARLWPAVLLSLWGAVALALLLRLALAHRRVALAARAALLPARPHEIEALERARRRVGARRSIDIARSSLPEAPAVLGIGRPRVVLPPAGCGGLSDDELESLLCHECAHVVRHDNLIATAVSVLSALFWFHPLVWIARRVLAVERERACDEIATGSAERGEIYFSALAKFCHAAIGPQLPGLSRMATSQLKERMDHVMRYPSLKDHSPSPARVTLLAGAALALFTLAAGLVGSEHAFAADAAEERGKADSPYSIRVSATKGADGAITVMGLVRETATQKTLAAPKLILDPSRRGGARTSAPGGPQITLETRPEAEGRIAVDVTIEKEGAPAEKHTLLVTPGDQAPATPAESKGFTGDTIDMNLTNAKLREVLLAFGQISGLEVKIDDGIEGKVSVSWRNIPWDEAFDSLVQEHGLTYRTEGKTLHVSRR